MAGISDVKCGKCDRIYSALRSRCPYCGARRNAAGKYARTDVNNRGKMIIGIVILALLAVAVVVILVVTNREAESDKSETSPTPTLNFANPSNDVLQEETTTPIAVPSPSPSPIETPPPAVQSIEVKSVYGPLPGAAQNAPEFTLSKSEKIELKLTVLPEGILDMLNEGVAESEKTVPVWTSQDTTKFTIQPTADGLTATAYWIAAGSTTLTVTVADKTLTITVHCSSS